MSEQPGRNGATWWAAVISLVVLTAITAVISYEHAYEVFRAARNTGALAILGPVVPDLVIAVCSMALLASAGQQAGKTERPWVATVALFVFIGVTIALNVAAGLRFGRGSALLAALAPVGYLTGLHILAGMIRRGRGGGTPASVPATSAICEHEPARPAMSLEEALAAAAPLMTQADLAEAFSTSRATVRRRLARGEQPEALLAELTAASTNGDGPHE
jgi:hypothetical protein